MNFNSAYRKLIVAVKESASDNARKTTEAIDRILDKGIFYPVISSSCGDNTDGTYVLASVETYLKYSEATGHADEYSVYSSVETYLKAQQAAGTAVRKHKLFLPSVLKLVKNLDANQYSGDRVRDKGIVEIENFSIIEKLDSDIDSWDFGDSTRTEVWDRILDKGIVFSHAKGRGVIASVETYLKYAEAVGLTNNGPA
jgi:hypothetical protein